MTRKPTALLSVFLVLAILLCACKSTGKNNSEGSDVNMSSDEMLSGEPGSDEPGTESGTEAEGSTAPGASNGTEATASKGASKASGASVPADGGVVSRPPVPTKTVTVNISEYAAYGDAHAMISEAITSISGKSNVAIIKGEPTNYRLLLEKNKTYVMNTALNFVGSKNIEIDGNGSTLVWTRETVGLYFNGSANVKITNMNLDYDPLPYTQGVVTNVSGNDVTLKVDAGYPSDPAYFNNSAGNDGLIWCSILQRSDGGVLPGGATSTAFTQNMTRIDATTVKLKKNFVSQVAGDLKKDSVIAIYHRGPSVIIVDHCTGMSFTNMNVYTSPGFGVSEGSSETSTYYTKFNIIPGPTPKGATEKRMRSVNADGLHFGNTKKGPIIDNCVITHLGDDCINVQGFYFHVLAISGKKITVTPKWDTPLTVGETIEGYKDPDYTSLGTAKITAFAKRNDSSMKEKIKQMYLYGDPTLGDDTLVYDITLDKALAFKVGDHITSLDRIGDGTVVKNSTFGYNRARGIVVKAPNAVIENNKITGNNMPAIVAAAELLWCESGFPVNMVIRNNTITNVGIAADMLHTDKIDMLGSIIVTISPPNNITGFAYNSPIKNVTIEGNVINGTGIWGIFALYCDGLKIRNNTINRPFMNGFGPNKIGNMYGITPTGGIFIGKSKSVTVTGNKITGAPAQITEAVTVHSTNSGVTNNSNSLAH